MKSTFAKRQPYQTTVLIERAIRRIRQRIFDMPDAKQDRAGMAIEKLKSRLPCHPAPFHHWMYAAE